MPESTQYKLIIFDWQGTLSQSGIAMSSVRELLQQLQEAGYTLAIATSMPLAAIKIQLHLYKLTKLFVHVQTSDMGYSKPDPQMLTTILEITGYKPEQALMVGDSEVDFAMAQAAKIDCVGMNAREQEIEQYHLKANYKNVLQMSEYLCPEN